MADANVQKKGESSQTQTSITQYMNNELMQTPIVTQSYLEESEVEKKSRPGKRYLMSDSPTEPSTAVVQRNTNTEGEPKMSEDQFKQIMDKLVKLENMQSDTAKRLAKLDTIEQSLDCVVKKVTHLELEIDHIKADKLEIRDELKKLSAEKDDIQTSLEFTQKEVQELQTSSKTLDDSVKSIEAQSSSETNAMVLEQAKLIRDEGLRLKQYSQRNNLIVTGVSETGKYENCVDILDEIFYQHLWVDVKHSIDKAHRLGKFRPNQRRPRPIIVRFATHSAKEQVFSNKRYLHGTKYGITPHTVEDIYDDHQLLKNALTIAQKEDSNAKVIGQKMLYKGEACSITQLQAKGLRLQSLHQRENQAEVHFLGRLSPLSNFHECPIKDKGRTFNSAEQMYQFCKAKEHGDMKAMAAIMLCNTAKAAKEEGKNIHVPLGNDPDGLKRRHESIMDNVLRCKFEQNQHLQIALKQTGDKVLYEANEHDDYWGTGVGLRDKALFQKTKRGENKLGQLLMHLRNEL